jgi:hypothetical protein
MDSDERTEEDAMAARDDGSEAVAMRVLDADEVEGVLSGSFYTERLVDSDRPSARAKAKQVDKPLHYKVICISMYTKDLERLDELVGALKRRGQTKANRSALIRAALDQLDLDKVPRGI